MDKIEDYLSKYNNIKEFYDSLETNISEHVNNINIALEGSLNINMPAHTFNELSINLLYPELKTNLRRYISYAEDYYTKGRSRS